MSTIFDVALSLPVHHGAHDLAPLGYCFCGLSPLPNLVHDVLPRRIHNILSLAVMLDDHPLYNLLFHPLVLALQLRHPIHFRARDAPLAHSRCILVPALPRDPDALEDGALHERHEAHVVIRVPEEEQPKARVATLVRGRLEDAGDGRFVVPAREHLHRVARVDDLRIGQSVI